MTTVRDLTPISQVWIRDYCDQLIEVAKRLPEGIMRDAVLRRVEVAQDLVEAWQKRNMPVDKR